MKPLDDKSIINFYVFVIKIVMAFIFIQKLWELKGIIFTWYTKKLNSAIDVFEILIVSFDNYSFNFVDTLLE